jgi:hypothetical protein
MEETFADGKPIHATVPRAPGKFRPRNERGRVCLHEGCKTLLSTYNPSPTCWAHQGSLPIKTERLTRPRQPGHLALPAA